MEEQACRQVDVVSVGIEINKQTHLHKINQRETLDQVIETIRYNLCLPADQKYALQFDKRNFFVTEKNRHEIKDGDVCLLVYAPEVLARTILARLHEKWALRKLLDFVADESLIGELENQGGVSKIVALLQEEALPPEVQELAFQVVATLFMQDRLPVEWLKGHLLDRVSSHVSGDCTTSSGNTVSACLRISLILYAQGAGQEEVPIEKLASHFDCESLQVQEAALALFNARLEKEGLPDRKLLHKVRDQLYATILEHYYTLSAEFKRHLTQFQARLMTRLVKKFESAAKLDDPPVLKRLNSLTQDDKRAKRDTFTESTLRLLAEFVVPPPEGATPPSLLLLDCLTHSVRNQIQHLPGSLMEHQPFLHLCNQLVKMQVEALEITGKAPLHPVLFCDRAFEEMFCACIRTLNKTCKEMGAKSEDLTQLLAVHAMKIKITLEKKPLQLADYVKRLTKISYNDVWEFWHLEDLRKQESEFRNKQSFLELREQLRPEYEELVKSQRLGVLKRGTRFRKFPSKPNQHLRGNKERFWTVTYLPKTKEIHFNDPEEKANRFSISLTHIKNVLRGANCPHVKTRGSKQNSPEFALSINLTIADPEFLNLGAPSATELDYWYDGIRMLLGQSMDSESYTKEIKDLLDMHLKIHFVGLEDIDFPDGPPPEVPIFLEYDNFVMNI